MRSGWLGLLLGGALLAGSAHAATTAVEQGDLAREKRMADEIVDAIFDGDPLWLEAGGNEFLGIYAETDEPGKAVIVLHGRGFHPDWEDAVNPLRVGLVEEGWATLSLQMPVLEKEAKYYDYIPLFPASFPRIEAGIAYLREQGHEQVVLIAHSCSVHMAMAWVTENGDASIDGFVGLGMGATDYQQPMSGPFPLDKMTVPVLDAFGSEEFPAVRGGAPARLQAISKAGNPQSRQIIIDGANHYFTDAGEPLVEAVAGWLNSLEFPATN